MFYRTVACDLQDLKDLKYDLLAFGPGGIRPARKNFPGLRPERHAEAASGPHHLQGGGGRRTAPDIAAPALGAPSMTMAIESSTHQPAAKTGK